MTLIAMQGPEATNYWADPPVMERACEAGDLQACDTFAGYLSWRGDETQQAQAIEIYQATCDKGYFKSCHNLALTYRLGINGAEKNSARAFSIVHTLCEVEQDARSCDYTADFYAEGDSPVGRNRELEFAYLSKACDLGYVPGCEDGARAALFGEFEREPGETIDLSRVKDLADKACQLGSEWGCGFLEQRGR